MIIHVKYILRDLFQFKQKKKSLCWKTYYQICLIIHIIEILKFNFSIFSMKILCLSIVTKWRFVNLIHQLQIKVNYIMVSRPLGVCDISIADYYIIFKNTYNLSCCLLSSLSSVVVKFYKTKIIFTKNKLLLFFFL